MNFFRTAASKSLIVMDSTNGILYWAEILKRKLIDGQKRAIALSTKEATDLIQNLESVARDAVRTAQAHEKLKFHCAYGDYAAKICTDLKAGPKKCAQLEPLVNVLAEKITQEESIILNSKGSFHNTPVLDALDERASELRTNSVTVDIDLAKFAVKAYSARNQACHSKGTLAGDCDLMAEAIEDGLVKLPNIFSDQKMVAMWTRILVYFRERNLVKNEFGSWTAVEVPKHCKKGISNDKSAEVEIVLPEYKDLSQAAKEKLIESVKLHKDEFDVSLFYPQAKATGPRKIRTYSNSENHHSVEWRLENLLSDRAPWLKKVKFEELANTTAKNGPPIGSAMPKPINECYESLHRQVCRYQDLLCELSRTESEMVLTKRLEELQTRCQKAMKRVENQRKDENAKSRRAARKAGNTASSTS